MSNKVQSHAEWRAEHPTEHPLWCRLPVTGGLATCDCDLAYPDSMTTQPHSSMEYWAGKAIDKYLLEVRALMIKIFPEGKED